MAVVPDENVLEPEFYIQTSNARHEGTYTWLCTKGDDRLSYVAEARFMEACVTSNRLAGFGSPKRQAEKILRAVAALRKYEAGMT